MSEQVPLEITFDESNRVVGVRFIDANGDGFVPESVDWWWTKQDGTVINDREEVSIADLQTINGETGLLEIPLDEDDTVVSENVKIVLRVFTIRFATGGKQFSSQILIPLEKKVVSVNAD